MYNAMESEPADFMDPALGLMAEADSVDPFDGDGSDSMFGGPFAVYNSAFENRADEEIALLAQQDDEPALEYLLG